MEAREMPEIRISGKRVLIEFDEQTRFLKTSFFISPYEDESRSVHIDFPSSARVFKIHASNPHSISGEFSKSDFIALSHNEDSEDRPGLLGSLEPYWLIAVIVCEPNKTVTVWEIGVVDKMQLEVRAQHVAWHDVQRLEPVLFAILSDVLPKLPKRPSDLHLPSFLIKKLA